MERRAIAQSSNGIFFVGIRLAPIRGRLRLHRGVLAVNGFRFQIRRFWRFRCRGTVSWLLRLYRGVFAVNLRF